MSVFVSTSQIGLFLIGGVFAWGGVHHFLHFRDLTGWLASRKWPFPALLLAAGSLFQIAAGGMLAFGLYVQPAALGLIAFTVVASVTLLDFWNQPPETRTSAQNAFTANIALIGGLILAGAIG